MDDSVIELFPTLFLQTERRPRALTNCGSRQYWTKIPLFHPLHESDLAVSRHFLTWNEPFLPQAASWLLDHVETESRGTGPVDLSNFLVVVPVASARKRLIEILLSRSGGRLLRPDIMTPAELPERLYPVKKPFASNYTQQMAWRKALIETPQNKLQRVVPKPPDFKAFRDWLSLSDLLLRQHRELAADGYDFQKVAELGPTIPQFPEQDRWNVLADIESRYLRILDSFDIWDQQEARLFAINNDECRAKQPIVLVGTSDLNRIVRQMLDQVVEQGAASNELSIVSALVHAPESEAHRFDSYGCLEVEVWESAKLPLTHDHVLVADGPADQAELAGVALAELGGRFPIDDIAVACADDRIVPVIEHRFAEAGVAATWAVGRSLDRSRPGRLLKAFADHLDRASAVTMHALLQHPDVLDLVEPMHRDDVLPQLNAYRASRHPRQLRADQVESVPNPEEVAALAAGVRAVEHVIEPLLSKSKRTVGGWAEAILTTVSRVYTGRELDREAAVEAETLTAIEQLSEISQQFGRCPTELNVRVDVGDAIRLIITRLGDHAAPPRNTTQSVTLTGWLEMPLDDRPVSIITSFNDGVIPTAVTSDLFLPGKLRQFLGLNDNARRYARDAYATAALIHSSEHVRFLVSRRDSDGNPQAPSRLLFTGTPSDTVGMFEHLLASETPLESLQCAWHPSSMSWDVAVPRVDLNNPTLIAKTRAPVRLSVTAFKDYIACPYRFYLKHILGLRPGELIEDELSASDFGSLVHTVLSRFGRDDVRHSTDEKVIREFVVETLSSHATSVYGTKPLPAIQVQLAKARRRLERFATVQSAHRAEGWHISYSETDEDDRSGTWHCYFDDHEGVTAQLKGRIDRVDQHEDGRWLILDYKTGDNAKKPLPAHWKSKSGEWIDLQLPLYRHLGESIGVTGRVSTGYFNLPKSADDCRVERAEFTDDQLESADDLARRILANVRAKKFDQKSDRVEYDDFAAICQADILEVASDGGLQ